MKNKIVTLELALARLRLATAVSFRLTKFDVIFGGGEANVAVSLANYGHESCFVSKLPAHESVKLPSTHCAVMVLTHNTLYAVATASTIARPVRPCVLRR